ncbi:DUF3016 domain-containing protein [Diaphorobacter aerolatus]|uniref:DUF3016 domain-containing protein n=1 Tax=Diaphorobacter aerolatus TaxID=1288495 RepID=A0A7H0GPT5_9BURK|nr:DUF3016 domain-containing protein [Diaphorobacter aerolatus]QNP50301.1 DUF3016 domain-containing protein [Diaphorobacter aerolatus]
MLCLPISADSSSLPGAGAWRAPAVLRRAAGALIMGATLLLAGGCTLLQKNPDQPPPPREIQPGTVSVTTDNPEHFTSAPSERRESSAARRAWVEKLSEHIADRIAAALPEGERAEVHISDIRRAPVTSAADSSGEARSAQGVVPPRITLTFKRLSSRGKVLQSGSRTLQDASLQLKAGRYADDSLRYEKALVDDWVSKEFKDLRR